MKRFFAIILIILIFFTNVNLSFANDFTDLAKIFIKIMKNNRFPDQPEVSAAYRENFCSTHQKNMHQKGYTKLSYKASGKYSTEFIMEWPMEGKEVADFFVKNTKKYLREMGFKKIIIKDKTIIDKIKTWEYKL